MLKIYDVMQYLDQSVNLTTVLVVLLGAAVTYLVGRRIVSWAFGWMKVIAFPVIVGGILFVGGLGGAGYGAGEMFHAKAPSSTTLDAWDLKSMANDQHSSADKIKLVVDYSEKQPSTTPEKPDGSWRTAWTLLLSGIGSVIIGAGILCRWVDKN